MDAKKNNKSLLIGVIGLVLQISCFVFGAVVGQSGALTGPVLFFTLLAYTGFLVGTGLLIWGMGLYAQALGHSGCWGLLGLFGILGLAVLGLLQDRETSHQAIEDWAGRNEAGNSAQTVSSRKRRKKRKPSHYTCIGCGYTLNGLVSSSCPECGRPFDVSNPATVDADLHLASSPQPRPPAASRWSLVCGFLGFLLFCVPGVGVLIPAVGVVCGHVAIIQGRRMPKRPDLSSAVAGLITSYLALCLSGALQGAWLLEDLGLI